MDNASTILTVFDRHLAREARLILYGRAAIQLGYDSPPPETARSLDVDGIIPEGEIDGLVDDGGFWAAQIAANEELRPRGLYITHLFQSTQVILRPDWLTHIIPITRPPLRFLKLVPSCDARSDPHENDARRRCPGPGRRGLSHPS